MIKKPNIKTDQNIETLLESKPKAYVLFYATWCPFSQQFLPLFTQYSKTNPDECISLPIDSKPELCDKVCV
jgi:thiol-disulfide isomerase/thioredoxin